VKYVLYYDEKISTRTTFDKVTKKGRYKKNIRNTNTACFAELPGMLKMFFSHNKVCANRLLYKVSFTKPNSNLTKTEIRKWAALCKKEFLLPGYAEKHFVKDGNLVIRLENLDINTLYIYLSMARYCEDEPYIIKTTLYFVEELGMRFLPALTLALACTGYGMGHAILPITKLNEVQGVFVGKPSKIKNEIFNKLKIPINYAIELRKLVFNGPKEEEKIANVLKEVVKGTKRFNFSLHQKLGYGYGSQSSNLIMVSPPNLLKEEAVHLIYSDENKLDKNKNE
jgi:hypothetical protein